MCSSSPFPTGSVLLFLTGAAEIQKAVAKIEEGIKVLPEGAADPLQVSSLATKRATKNSRILVVYVAAPGLC